VIIYKILFNLVLKTKKTPALQETERFSQQVAGWACLPLLTNLLVSFSARTDNSCACQQECYHSTGFWDSCCPHGVGGVYVDV
jgi:hypothetical protein